MSVHLIVGAGPVGTATTRHLLDLGHEVRVVTRSGGGLHHDRVERVVADAADSTRLIELAEGAASVINAANPPYHRWDADWPPLGRSMMDAAERRGARLVSMGNLYAYAADSSPMAATDPLDPPTRKGRVRAALWDAMLERHRLGRLDAVEVRASDFVGPGLGDSAHLGSRFVDAVLAGSTPRVVGRPDQPHSWTYVDDVGRVLALAATLSGVTGRAWHVPTEPPRTAQQMADGIADAAGVSRVTVGRIPRSMLAVAGWFSPTIREVREMVYQFDRPFVIDDTDTREVFGAEPTPLTAQCRAIAVGVDAGTANSVPNRS